MRGGSLLPAEAALYRANAIKARVLAHAAMSEQARTVLLNDARLWDRMATDDEPAAIDDDSRRT